MDVIRQYQRLSNIKPSYQKLTLPYYGVSKSKIQHNLNELELYYKGPGVWDVDDKPKKKGGAMPEKRELIVFLDFDDQDLYMSDEI
jgi:hypothetical protein